MKLRGKDCAGRRKNLNEEWRPITGHEGYYWLSNTGRVKNADGRELSKVYCGGNSYKVKLQSRGQREERYLTTLMAEIFPELTER